MLKVDKSKCNGDAVCTSVCQVEAITLSDSKAEIDPDLCIECFSCITVCPQEAIYEEEEE